MKIEYYKANPSNFGDALNSWLWPRLLPNFFDDNPNEIFIGIGSIIGESYEVSARKIVAGAGYVPAYHSQIPNLLGKDWDVFFLRGRKTAQLLGLPESLGIGDSATLLSSLNLQFQRTPCDIGFMPHWESIRRGSWQKVCKLAGIRLINPCLPVDQVIAELITCKVLITEAMHGAIVADTLRVPWVPVLPIDGVHRDKWLDWSDTVGVELKRYRLWPSNPEELKLATNYRPFLSKLATISTRPPVDLVARPFLGHLAAQRLSDLARRPPILSEDGVVEKLADRMLEKLRLLEKRYRKVR